VIVAFHVILLVALLAVLVAASVNVANLDRLAPTAPPQEGPLVSVLIPARNEAHNIAQCVGSVLAQDWPNLEVVVLDDRSEDGTGEILRTFHDPRLRVIHGAELPAGWVGKNWACHQLSQAARGEWLIFIDADTAHASGFVSAAIPFAQKTRADLVSAWPRLITISLGEKLVVPIIPFFGMVFYPHALVLWLQRHPHVAARVPRSILRGLGAANGQCIIFPRASYDRLGGHAARPDHLVEDLAFGRAVTERMAEGARLVNCEATGFSTCRMYRSFAETWSGFTKNACAAFEGNYGAFIFFGMAEFWLMLWPFLAVFLPFSPKPLVLIEIGIILLLRAGLAARLRTSWLSVLLHPVGVSLALAIGLNSWLRSYRGGVDWKGRRYVLPSSPTP